MRPNTPHAVYTPDHAICHGGHFYATSTIQDTCFGAFHTFVSSSTITNTEHVLDSRRLLRRQLLLYSDVIHSQCKPEPKLIYGAVSNSDLTCHNLIILNLRDSS